MRRIGQLFFVLAVACSCSSAASSGPNPPENVPPSAPAPTSPVATTPAPPPSPVVPFDALARRKAEMLTSIWENGTTVLQYPYAENIGDGRGYTCGRAGFCTGTGDAVQVAHCLDTATNGQNPLHKYLGALDALNATFESSGKDQGGTKTLDAIGDFPADWAASAKGPTAAAFTTCQDKIVEMLYLAPALATAAKWGLTTSLSKAALYDAEINHGGDGVDELAKQANIDVGNTAQTAASQPLARDAESAWLEHFLLRRLATLKADPTWVDSVDRAAEYESLRRAGNWDLAAPIVSDAKAKILFPSGGYKDSGAPRCIIAPDATVSGDAACTSPTGN